MWGVDVSDKNIDVFCPPLLCTVNRTTDCDSFDRTDVFVFFFCVFPHENPLSFGSVTGQIVSTNEPSVTRHRSQIHLGSAAYPARAARVEDAVSAEQAFLSSSGEGGGRHTRLPTKMRRNDVSAVAARAIGGVDSDDGRLGVVISGRGVKTGR